MRGSLRVTVNPARSDEKTACQLTTLVLTRPSCPRCQRPGRNLVLDLAGEETLIERTEGVTAAFLKELLRKAALLSCESDEAGEGPIRVTDAHVTVALDQLLDGRNQLTRVLLGGER